MGRFDNMQDARLTPADQPLQARLMTKSIATLACTAALSLALAACNQEDHTIVAGPPDDSETASAASNVVLPPAVKVSKTYRCADDSIVHIDWLADDKSATVRPDKGGSAAAVSAAEAGQPMAAADGTSLSGTASDGAVRLGLGGKPAQSCKA